MLTKKSVLVLKDHKPSVHYKNPTGSRALGDEKMKAAKKGGKKPSQNLGLAKSSFSLHQRELEMYKFIDEPQ